MLTEGTLSRAFWIRSRWAGVVLPRYTWTSAITPSERLAAENVGISIADMVTISQISLARPGRLSASMLMTQSGSVFIFFHLTWISCILCESCGQSRLWIAIISSFRRYPTISSPHTGTQQRAKVLENRSNSGESA